MVIFINHYQIYLKQFNISNSFAYNSTRPTFPILSIEQNNWLDFTLNRIHSNVRFQFQYHHFTSISFQQWSQFTRIKISTREKRNNSSTLIFLAKRARNSLSLSLSLSLLFNQKLEFTTILRIFPYNTHSVEQLDCFNQLDASFRVRNENRKWRDSSNAPLTASTEFQPS